MGVIRRFSACVFLMLVGTAIPALAQEASILGTVYDESKAVLPGVTVTATEVSKGTQFTAVSDEHGEYRITHLTPGTFKVQADLQGFASTVIEKVPLLVGQNVTATITMKVATVAETLTVVGESPIVDTTTTQVSGNVNPKQMEAVPLLGRNWLELSKMVSGMTANVVTTYAPGVTANQWGMNLDGQMVANKTSQSLGQPKFSRDAIAEYQIITNLYDVTQGRSTGVQVQAITKSGTNQITGSGYGFFRSDKWNAADPISHTVLPYKDEQWGGTLGGPIIKDKLFYFFAYEPERTPATIFSSVQALGQSYSVPNNVTSNSLMLRIDDTLNGNNRLSIRSTYSSSEDPHNLVAGQHPSQSSDAKQGSFNILGTWSRVISSSAVQEARVGLKHFSFSYVPLIDTAVNGQTLPLAPEYDFPGLTLGPVYWMPQWHHQDYPSARYDLTVHKGSHDWKIGGEFIGANMWDNYHVSERGRFTFTSLPPNLGALIPQNAIYDPTQWDIAGLSAYAQRFNVNFPRTNFTWTTPDPEFAAWIGDTWRVKSNLTINYGVRYDNFWYEASPPGITTNSIQINQYSNGVLPTTNLGGMTPGDFGYKTGTHDNLDFGPQGGFAWNVGGSNNLVIHGGTGLYYTVYEKSITKVQILNSNLFSAQFNNNGNPNFILNPTSGITNYAEASQLPIPQGGTMVSTNLRSPETWQSGLGLSKQIGANTGVTADLVYRKVLHELVTLTPNLYYNPATGYNVSPSVGVPNPAWGQFSYATSDGKGEYSALQTSLNRRVSNRIQGGASYTLMFTYKDVATGSPNNPFDPINGEYATSSLFQRSTFRGWASYDLPLEFSVSATYSYGSGNRYNANIASNPYGGTVTNRLNLLTGGAAAPAIVVPSGVLSQWEGPAVIGSGVVIPRDALDGTSFNRVDLRLTKSVTLAGHLRGQAIAEVFNVFNASNYTNFNTVLSATAAATTAKFGLPIAADIPREAQFAFRISF